MESGKQGFTQPVTVGAYFPPGQTVSTYTQHSFGCTAMKNGSAAAGFTLVFDERPLLNRFTVVATPVAANAAAGISAIVVTPAATAAGEVAQVIIICVDDAHVAIDCGLMVTIVPIPDKN